MPSSEDELGLPDAHADAPEPGVPRGAKPGVRSRELATPRVAIGIVAAGLVAGALPMFLVAALAPRIDAELGIGTRGTGMVVASFFLAAAVGSIPGGRAADRLGSRRALQLGLSITVIGTSLAATLGQGTVSLVLTMGFAGFALSFLDPGGARTLAAAVTSDRHGMAFGVKEASIPMASLLAGASLPLIPAEFGWRPTFIGAAVLATIVAVVVPRNLEHRTMRDGARDLEDAAEQETHLAARADSTAQANIIEVERTAPPDTNELKHSASSATGDGPRPSAAPGPSDEANSTGASARPVRPAGASKPSQPPGALDLPDSALVDDPRARRLSLIVLAFVAAFGGGIAAGFSTYLVTSTVDAGFSPEAAGIVFAASSLVAVIVRLVVGRVADGGPPGRELRLLRGAMVIGAVGIAISALGTPMTSVIGGLIGLGAGWGWTGLVFLAAVRIDPQRPAAASGVVLAGLAIGGVIGPALFGLIAELSGFSMVFSLAGAVMAITSVVVSIPIRQIRPAAYTTTVDHAS